MPGRQDTVGSQYKYGFNGKEKDNDIDGTGVDYDYGARVYDARAARFFSVDPITKEYPELSTYQFASNTPIQAIDLDGLEKYIIHYKIETGLNIILKVVTDYSLKYLGGPTVFGQPTLHPKVVQFIQEDKSGKILSTTGEIALKNFGSTLYVGPLNPKYGKEDGTLNGTDRYDYPAINSLDLAAKHHDLGYDKVKAVGAAGAFVDLETLPFDKQLLKDASGVVVMGELGIIDPVNKQPINDETLDAAKKVVVLFSAITAEKEARIAAKKVAEAVKTYFAAPPTDDVSTPQGQADQYTKVTGNVGPD